jgi:hypothetical protein
MESSSKFFLKSVGIMTIGVLSCIEAKAQEPVLPIPNLSNNSTGIILTNQGRGSGVVAKDARLVYSCGHNVYDEGGVWSTGHTFHRAYHAWDLPTQASGAATRGYRALSRYAPSVESHGPTSALAFSQDFAIFYGNTSFGTPMGWWPAGGPVLRSSTTSKTIVGYPAVIFNINREGNAFQYTTGPSNLPANQTLNNYYFFDGIISGPGNSGGPLFVPQGGANNLAAILISGHNQGCGVRALDAETDSLANQILTEISGVAPPVQPVGISRTATNGASQLLPDGSPNFVSKQVTVTGMPGTIRQVKFSGRITTTYRGDLEVFLVSPQGRIRWINKRQGAGADNLIVNQADYTSSFKGLPPSGKWTLKMRDASRLDKAIFRNFTLTVTSL